MEKTSFPPNWTWLFPPVYGLHLLDEYFTSIGLAVWSTQQSGITFTEAAWLAVNVPSLALFTVSTSLAVRRTWPP